MSVAGAVVDPTARGQGGLDPTKLRNCQKIVDFVSWQPLWRKGKFSGSNIEYKIPFQN